MLTWDTFSLLTSNLARQADTLLSHATHEVSKLAYINFELPSKVPITRLAPSFLRSYESPIEARTTGWIFTTGPYTDMLEKENVFVSGFHIG